MMSLQFCNKILSHPDKELREHLIGVSKISKKLLREIPLNSNYYNLLELEKVIEIIGLYHDIGKATPFFQEYLKEKDENKKSFLKNQPETKHSLLSAIATFFAVEKLLKEIIDDEKVFLSYMSFFVVRRHHSNLESATDDLKINSFDVLKKQVKYLYSEYLSFLPYWSYVFEKLKSLFVENWPLRKVTLTRLLKKNSDFSYYLLQNLIYSLLLDADKHEIATGIYFDRKKIPFDMVEFYRAKKGFGKSTGKINIVRNEIFFNVVNQVDNIKIDKDHILSLSAPTGSGKTLTSIAFALKLRERILKEKNYNARIIYCLPFLSIIDQNAKIIEEVFKNRIGKLPGSDLFLTFHHLSDYSYKTTEEEYDIDTSKILIEGWDSEFIITTFVQLFHSIFTNRNSIVRKFNKIAGSIIILDEIQSFPHKYWLLFRKSAEALAKYFNNYFILTTATQPAIFENPRELLLEKEKYFMSLKRTKIKIDIEKTKTISEFSEEFIESFISKPENTLIVLNTISASRKFFSIIKENLKETKYELFYLSSYVTPYERIKRIEKIKNSNVIKIIVATQLVEAGIDIDVDRVIRDFGPLDTINQVSGRANRNWRKNYGEILVVLLKEEKREKTFHSYIYDPVLIDNTMRILKNHCEISEENFLQITVEYFQKILNSLSDDISNEYIKSINMLDYDKIREFKLIEDEEEKIDIFVELNSEATRVWKEYCNLINIKDLIKKKLEFLRIRNKFYKFVISVRKNDLQKNLPPEVLGIKFISKSQLSDYYDLEVGFKNYNEFSIW